MLSLETAHGDPQFVQLPEHANVNCFEFKLLSQRFPPLNKFLKSLSVDHQAQTIELELYDGVVAGKPVIHEYVAKLLEDDGEAYTLMPLSPTGHPLYNIGFDGLQCVGHSYRFDYAGTGSLLHKLTIRFDRQVIG